MTREFRWFRRYKLLIDAIVAYEPEKKLKRHPRCVDGGYAEFNLT